MNNSASSVLSNSQLLVAGLLSIIVCLNVPNTALTLFACFVFLFILKNLWMAHQPAIFLFGLIFQWSQASLRIFQANAAGVPLDQYDGSPNASVAAYTALLATLLVSSVLSIFIRKSHWDRESLMTKIWQVNIKKLFIVHIAFFSIMPAIALLKIGGLSQVIVSIESLKWLAFTCLAIAVFVQKRFFALFGISFVIELLMGFTGYFSGFKTVVFFSIIALLSVTEKITIGRMIAATSLFAFVLGLGLFWTSIKGEYRSFVSGGQRAQIVSVSSRESLEFIFSNMATTGDNTMSTAFNALINRLQYTKMIQLVMDYVPTYLEHQQGKQWQDAINHILKPRMFFPEKLPLDDSAITSKYTGMRWAGAQEGTSISIGYVAESYVDYGIPGMFVPIAILAFFIGLLYRSLVIQPARHGLLFYITIIVLFFRFSHIETSIAKVIGGLITTYLVYMFIIRPLVFPALWKFITKKS